MKDWFTEQNEFLKILLPFIAGTIAPLIGAYANYLLQRRRDQTLLIKERERLKSEERQVERKLELEQKERFRAEKIQAVNRATILLNFLQHYTSLTSSAIDTSKQLSPIEFSDNFKKELEKLFELSGIISSHFPELYDHLLSIDGELDNYWGNQNLLLHVDAKKNYDQFSGMQQLVIEASKATYEAIKKLHYELLQVAEKLNDKAL